MLAEDAIDDEHYPRLRDSTSSLTASSREKEDEDDVLLREDNATNSDGFGCAWPPEMLRKLPTSQRDHLDSAAKELLEQQTYPLKHRELQVVVKPSGPRYRDFLYGEFTFRLNEVIKHIDPQWVQSTLLPLRKHYVRFACAQVHTLSRSILENTITDKQFSTNKLTQIRCGWTICAQALEKSIVKLYTGLQEAIIDASLAFDQDAYCMPSQTVAGLRLWLYHYLDSAISKVRKTYLESENGSKKFLKDWQTEFPIVRELMMLHNSEAVKIFEVMEDYQPRFEHVPFLIDSRSTPDHPHGEYKYLCLPRKVALPSADVSHLIKVCGIPFDTLEENFRHHWSNRDHFHAELELLDCECSD